MTRPRSRGAAGRLEKNAHAATATMNALARNAAVARALLANKGSAVRARSSRTCPGEFCNASMDVDC
eukprot:9957444-Alexandrium_andersonii.AAC.1